MASVIGKLGKINTLNAENKFAFDDANLHRNNIRYADTLGGRIQNQKNIIDYKIYMIETNKIIKNM